MQRTLEVVVQAECDFVEMDGALNYLGQEALYYKGRGEFRGHSERDLGLLLLGTRAIHMEPELCGCGTGECRPVPGVSAPTPDNLETETLKGLGLKLEEAVAVHVPTAR